MRYKKIKLYINLFVIIIMGCIFSSLCNNLMMVYASDLENAEKREVKVLVISIDPEITNPMTNKKQKASEYLGFSLQKSVNSLESYIEQGANGVVDIKIVETIYLKEFPTYDGFDSMTEEQFFKLFPIGTNGKGEWYDWWTRNSEQNVIPSELDSAMHFDYSYLVEKCNLVKKRNAGKFDMVWVYGIDPLSMYETAMVGDSAFWVNGKAVEADCENFVIAGLTFSRADGALESFCHLCESMLNYTYGVSDREYNKPIKFDDFSELSTWQKFYLCQDKSTSDNTVYGVGQVHFAPNSIRDYDWESNIPVSSYHQVFLDNYPNITNDVTTIFTANEYLSKYDSDAAGVCHHIWWLQHMPHYEGRDENGYSHNWWDYIFDTKYVKQLKLEDNSETNTIIVPLGESVLNIPFKIQYNTGNEVSTTLLQSGAVLKCEENAIFSLSGNKINGLSVGKEKITIMYDGHNLECFIEVQERVNSNIIANTEKNKPIIIVKPKDPENTQSEENKGIIIVKPKDMENTNSEENKEKDKKGDRIILIPKRSKNIITE